MHAEKTVGMSFRVSPMTKRLLVAASEHERRSLTNMLEVLVEDYCSRNGILKDSAAPIQEQGRARRRTK